LSTTSVTFYQHFFWKFRLRFKNSAWLSAHIDIFTSFYESKVYWLFIKTDATRTLQTSKNNMRFKSWNPMKNSLIGLKWLFCEICQVLNINDQFFVSSMVNSICHWVIMAHALMSFLYLEFHLNCNNTIIVIWNCKNLQ